MLSARARFSNKHSKHSGGAKQAHAHTACDRKCVGVPMKSAVAGSAASFAHSEYVPGGGSGFPPSVTRSVIVAVSR